MEFTVSSADLVRELGLLRGIASRQATIPILGNVLIRADGDLLTLTATDLDLSLRCDCPARVKKAGAATIPARRLYDYVRLLPDSDVSIQLQPNHWLSVSSGKARARLAGMSADVFPNLPEMPEALFELPAKALAMAIARTEFAISREDSRFSLNGALLLIEEDAMQLVASDGHRLALSRCASSVTERIRILIPRQALAQIQKLMAAGDPEEMLEFAIGENNLFFRIGARQFMSRQLTGTFPDYEAILPDGRPHMALLDRASLIGVIERVDQFSDEMSRQVRMKISAGEVLFRSSISDIGESEEGLPAEYSGPAVEIGFNAGYLLDFLRAATENQVSFLFKGSADAGEFRPVGSDDAAVNRYVVMPMRI
jgi:DNA polymerase-3 subunit beta